MKRSGYFLVVVSILGLFTFPCAFDKSLAQGLELHPNAAKPVGDVKSDVSDTGSAALAAETNRPGDFKEGQLSGAADFTLSGTLKPGDMSGSSVAKAHETVVAADGTIYEGEVANRVPNGQGIVTDSRGTRQQGEYRNGQAYRVSGTWVDYDGTKEEGTWNVDGSKCGGTITWKNGRVYKGDWKIVDMAAELPHGDGTMTWPDGRKYVGQFRDGQMEGQGKMTYPDGKVEDGFWKQSKFVGAAK